MERAVAVKKLRKMLGPKFGYEINPNAPSDEERAAAQAAQKGLYANRDAAVKLMRDRMDHLLDNDPTYQQLKEQAAVARKTLEDNNAVLMTHKIVVGTANGLFFSVAAQAHSWEDIFKILARREERLKK